MVLGRGIMAKQVSFAFYRPSALVLARTIADLPILAVQNILFTILIYWMAGLAADAGKFFINLLIVYVTSVCMTAFYRAIGAFSKDLNVSIRIAFLFLNILALFAGYMQPFHTMKSWVYKWIYWADPIHYGLEALMVNQLDGLDLTCEPSHLVPNIPGASIMNQVCTLTGARPQSAIVAGADYLEGFGYNRSHLWRNFGLLIAFTMGYIVIAD